MEPWAMTHQSVLLHKTERDS